MLMLTMKVLVLVFYYNLLTAWVNCFNLSSSIDKDELWHMLLNRQISQNDSTALVSPSPQFNYDNVRDNEDVVSVVNTYDKVNESSYDAVDGDLSEDEVKVEYNEHDESYISQNKTIDNELKSQFMDIFNVSVIQTADTIRDNNSDVKPNIGNNELNSNNDLSDCRSS